MEFFVEFSAIIFTVVLISILFKILRQPLIIGYLLSGLIVGPYSLNLLKSNLFFEVFSEFGIVLLLFIVGLNLAPTIIKEIGKVAVIAGVGQVLITLLIGLLFCLVLGFNSNESIYIAIALTFSSTIIVLKMLSDVGDLESLYGKIAIGVLIIQDVTASILLIFLNSFSNSENVGLSEQLISIFAYGGLLSLVLFIFIKFIFPRLLPFLASSQELLFIFALGWGLGVAAIFEMVGFSVEIGALVAGVCLSLFPYHYEISSKMKPLRDFFLIIFFVSLGSKIDINELNQIWGYAIIFSIFVLVIKPLIVLILMGKLGYKKRTSFLTGLTIAQVSEFSLIIIAFGINSGVISSRVSTLMTVVAFVTITISSYLVMYSKHVYLFFRRYLKVFEKKNVGEGVSSIVSYDIILFGYNRVGFDVVEKLKRMNSSFLVVDHDPESIKLLNQNNYANLYGDAEDGDFLDELPLNQVKMVVSTIPDYDVNAFLVSKIKENNTDALILLVAHSIQNAFNLYEMGVDYVIMPHFLGGEYASNLILNNRFSSELFGAERDKHIADLIKRKKLGHDHPRITRK